ncbi:hypothetical protein [Exiguobacterium sp. s28]|uniref:hypothetical protein n=1 Tax=Exiguobacterium sp. s28 TaxID=2751238 RepID=UPI001BE81722|nr:hypothetical protein [Exiguobacterium sp. s28]
MKEHLGVFDTYIGKGARQLSWDVGLNPDLNESKAKTSNITKRLIDHHKETVEHLENGIEGRLMVKSVNLNKKGKSKQNTVLEVIDFLSWVETGWEDSAIMRCLGKTTFLFMVYGENKEGDAFFLGPLLWKPSDEEVQGLKSYWKMVTDILIEGVQMWEAPKGKEMITKNNLPGQGAHKMVHIRPKANNKNDVTLLPDGQTITKQGLWLNAKYVSDIVSPLFEIRKDEINLKRDMVSEGIELDETELDSLKGIVTEDAYTPETFVEACRQVIRDFNLDWISKDMVESLGYRISSPYILGKKYLDSRSYIEEVILGNDYFKMEDTPILSHPYASRMIAKMRDGWRIIEIETDLYITERALSKAGITVRLLESYRESVFGEMETGRFYTIEQLVDLMENDPLEEYGFDERVYEGILRRPGKISNMRVGETYLFTSGMSRNLPQSLLDDLMKRRPVLRLADLREEMEDTYEKPFGDGDLVALLKRSSYHFATDIDMVFESKDAYLSYLYNV